MDDLSFPLKAVIFKKNIWGSFLQLGMMYFQGSWNPQSSYQLVDG